MVRSTIYRLCLHVNMPHDVEQCSLKLRPTARLGSNRTAGPGRKGKSSKPISLHGMRIGFVAAAHRNGVPDDDILE